jgi:O-antigen/teichoic acid export membrane protein
MMPTPPLKEPGPEIASDPRDRLLDYGEVTDLKGRAMRGGATVLVAQGVKFTFQFGAIVILSRMLVPADFGLVAMVTAITGLALVLKDVGLSQSTVQRPHVTQRQVSTLFWLNAGAGFLIFAILCGLAPVITWFYGDWHLKGITIASACQFIFAGLTVQHLALLNRDMQFRKLVLIDISSLAAGSLVGIAMAALGYGYWALVGMPVFTSIAAAILAWTLSSWRPCLPRFDRGVSDMLRMGRHLAGFNIVNYFARNLDNALIGWRWGAESLGFYSRSYSLFTLPLSQINGPLAQVAIAGLSRAQENPTRFAAYYEKAAVLSMSLTTPLAAFTIVAAPEILAVVLGPQWTDCVPIFRWLGLGGLFQPLCNSTGWIYISSGRSDRMFRWGSSPPWVIV